MLELIPLDCWFRELAPAALRRRGVLTRAAAAAEELLGEPREVGVLHGDIHHGNVLDFGLRGWLAIDPKGLVGERGFDFANIFCSPDLEIAVAPGRVRRQVQVVAEAAGLERTRLLKWILAYAGLSAAMEHRRRRGSSAGRRSGRGRRGRDRCFVVHHRIVTVAEFRLCHTKFS